MRCGCESLSLPGLWAYMHNTGRALSHRLRGMVSLKGKEIDKTIASVKLFLQQILLYSSALNVFTHAACLRSYDIALTVAIDSSFED